MISYSPLYIEFIAASHQYHCFNSLSYKFIMTLLFILKSLIFSQLLLLLVSAQEGKCPPSFDCGNLGQINFPFTVTQHPQCGILAISGCDDKDPSASKSTQLGNTPFNVTYVANYMFTITNDVQRKKLQNKNCEAINNLTLPPISPIASFYIKYNITMFKCNHTLNVTLPESFYKYTNCTGYNVYYSLPNTMVPPGFKEPSSLAQCTMFQVGVRASVTGDPFDFLSPEIYIQIQLSDDCNKCLRHHGGRCQLNIHGNFHCAKGMHK